MKILETIRKNYAILGITSAQSLENHPFNKKITMAFVLIGLATFFHIMHVLCVASNLKERMESTTTTSGSLLITICFLTIILKTRTVFDCIHGFEDVIATRLKYPASAEIFDKTNRRIEKFGKIIMFVVLKLGLNCAIWLQCVGCFKNYFFTDMGSDAFVLPVPMWFPFDTKNPTGYLLACCFQYIHLAYELFFVLNLISLAIGVFMFALTSIKVLKDILRSINAQCTENKSKRKRLQAFKQVREYVQMHSAMKQIFDMISSITQPIMMFLLVWCLAAICSGLLVIQMAKMHNELNEMTLGIAIVDTLAAAILMFIFCEFGQRISNAFEEISDEFDKFNWYRFPMKIQRLLPIIMIVTQQPVAFEVFGSITCCRDVLKKMVNTIYSYSMIFRKFIT